MSKLKFRNELYRVQADHFVTLEQEHHHLSKRRARAVRCMYLRILRRGGQHVN